MFARNSCSTFYQNQKRRHNRTRLHISPTLMAVSLPHCYAHDSTDITERGPGLILFQSMPSSP